jgi:hypothetical protein
MSIPRTQKDRQKNTVAISLDKGALHKITGITPINERLRGTAEPQMGADDRRWTGGLNHNGHEGAQRRGTAEPQMAQMTADE